MTDNTVPHFSGESNPASNYLLVAALGYARQGIRVFPCYSVDENGVCECWKHEGCTKNPGKHPRTAHGLSDATTSELTIRQWWKLWPTANIGLRTGSKMVVLDPDDADGIDEAETYGVDPDGIHSTTGRGRHYLFKPPDGVVLQNHTKNLGTWPLTHCDARGEGGYIIAPPSRHYSSRPGALRLYAWANVLDAAALPPVPDKLLEAWRTPPEDPRSAEIAWDDAEGCWVEVDEEVKADSGEGVETAKFFLEWYIHKVRGDGAVRNATGFNLALQLRDAPLSQDAALPFMRNYQQAVENFGDHAYEWKEAEASLKQAFTRPKRRPAHSTEQEEPKQQSTKFDWRQHDLTARTLQSKEIVPKEFLVAGIVPYGYTQVAGRPKSGKSTLALQIAVAETDNRQVFDAAVKQGTVIYLALEDTEERTKARLHNMIGLDKDGKELPWPEKLHLFYTWPTIAEGGLEYLTNIVHAYTDTVCVMIDSLKLFRGPVKHNGGYDQDYEFSNQMSVWVNAQHCNVLAVLHTAKRRAQDSPDDDPTDMVQNTTGITAGADTILVMRKQDGVMTLYRVGRDLENSDPIKLKGNPQTLLWSLGNDQDDSICRDCILVALEVEDSPLQPKDFAIMTAEPSGTIRNCLYRMLREPQPVIGVCKAGYYLLVRGKSNKPPKTGGWS